MFIPLKDASMMHDIPKKSLLNLYYADKEKGRTDRFIVENGIVKVHQDHLCPHRVEMEMLYLQALETTNGKEKEIARAISKKTGKEVRTVYMYLRNFRFKNYEFARTVMSILKEYIATHNLFYARGIE